MQQHFLTSFGGRGTRTKMEDNQTGIILSLSILLGCFDPKPLALEYYYDRVAFKSNWDGTIQYFEVRWCCIHCIFTRQTLLRLAEHTCWQSLETHYDFFGLICQRILFDPVCHVIEPKRLEGVLMLRKHKQIWEFTSR